MVSYVPQVRVGKVTFGGVLADITDNQLVNKGGREGGGEGGKEGEREGGGEGGEGGRGGRQMDGKLCSSGEGW